MVQGKSFVVQGRFLAFEPPVFGLEPVVQGQFLPLNRSSRLVFCLESWSKASFWPSAWGFRVSQPQGLGIGFQGLSGSLNQGQ